MSKYKEINHLNRLTNVLREWYKRQLNWEFFSYRLLWNFVARYDHVTKFPLHLDIETTDSCNLKCIMCVHGLEGVPDTGMIDMRFAKKMIGQAAKGGTKSIKFNWRGEPALHKGLEELVKEAKNQGILEVQINTNGIPFTEKRIRSIIDCGLDRIIFSMDGATKETYEKIRIKADFDKLMKNIKLFYDIRSEKKQVKPFIRIQMVKMKDNESEVNNFLQMWKEVADDIVVKDVTDRGQGGEFYAGNQVATGRKRCNQPWQRMIVARDGKVFPCCSDWNRTWEIGDANTTPLHEIWKGKKMSQMRQINRDKKLNDYEPCKDCFVLSSYEWKRATPKERGQIDTSIVIDTKQ
jgi:radical SAM protein with 4Fe4S-binding SPASM domain